METKNISINDIKLDFLNPRFSNFNFETEDEIIEYLKKYENIKELVESIEKNGYVSLGEPLIVLEERNFYTVLEGNRRVAALKTMLSNNSMMIPDNIRCDIVKDREEALFKISSKHITGMKKWSAIEKKQFYENLFISFKNNGIETNKAIEEISEFTTDSPYIIKKEITTLYFVQDIYNLVKNKFDDLAPLSHINSDVLTGRVYNRLSILLNLEIDDNLKVFIPNALEDTYNSILFDFGKSLWIDEILDTRLINTNNEFDTALENELSHIGKKIKQYIQLPQTVESNSKSNQPSSENPDNLKKQIDNKESYSLNNKKQSNPIDKQNISQMKKDNNSNDKSKKATPNEIIRLGKINETLTLTSLPYDLTKNIKLSVDNKKVNSNKVTFRVEGEGNIFISNSSIEEPSENGTYPLIAEYKGKSVQFTVTINRDLDKDKIMLIETGWYQKQVKALNAQPEAEKIVKVLTILHSLDLNNELDLIVATPTLRCLIEYSLQYYNSYKPIKKLDIAKNLSGSFNQVLNTITSRDDNESISPNQAKQLKSVSQQIESLNAFIHNYKGIAPGNFLLNLFNLVEPLLNYIYDGQNYRSLL